ncbi:glycosyltransferase [Parabacteroides sp.]
MSIHLLFIAHDLGEGGAERVLNNLDYSRYQVDLLIETDQGAVYLDKLPKSVRVFYTKDFFREINKYEFMCKLLYKMHCSPLFLFISRFFIRLSTFNKLGKYEGVISFLEGSSVVFHSFWLTNKNAFHISWVHCDPLADGYNYCFPAFYKMYYCRMDHIVTVIEGAKRSFIKVYDIPEDKIKVIYNPVDKENIIKESDTFCVEKRKLTIGFVGRLYKRADRLIRVARLFKDVGYDLEFWFLGDAGNMKELCRELKVEDCCVFYGFRKNPYPYMKALDIYISTSDSEACSMTISEACCLGRPVVSTRTIGSSELLDNGKYGVLTDFDDQSVFLALKSLIDDPDLRHYYEKKALERSENFNLSQPLNEITQLFEKY